MVILFPSDIYSEVELLNHMIVLFKFLRNIYSVFYAGKEMTVRTRHGTTDWFKNWERRMSRLYTVTCLFNLYAQGFPGSSFGKKSSWNMGDLGLKDPLGKGVATYFSIVARRIPWTEEPGRLQSMGSQRVRHGWTSKHSTEYIMQNAGLDEAQAGIKTTGRNSNQICKWNHPYGRKQRGLKSLLMKVKEESEKADLKLNIQKSKIMASGPITSWQIDGYTVWKVTDFYFLGFKNHCRGWLQPWN